MPFLLKKLLKTKYHKTKINDITKDILGISMPLSAISLAKVVVAEMIKKKMKELFIKENVIILSNNKNIREIEKILKEKNIKFKIGKFFKGKWKNLNEKSLSICLENATFEEVKYLAIEIVKKCNQKIIVKDIYNIYLIS